MSRASDREGTGKEDDRSDKEFTVGVEEEFQIVDAETRDLRQNVERVLATAEDTRRRSGEVRGSAPR